MRYLRSSVCILILCIVYLPFKNIRNTVYYIGLGPLVIYAEQTKIIYINKYYFFFYILFRMYTQYTLIIIHAIYRTQIRKYFISGLAGLFVAII